MFSGETSNFTAYSQLHETKNYSFELLNIILLNVIFVCPRWRQVLRGLWQLLGLNPHCDLPAEFSWTICIREKMHIDNYENVQMLMFDSAGGILNRERLDVLAVIWWPHSGLKLNDHIRSVPAQAVGHVDWVWCYGLSFSFSLGHLLIKADQRSAFRVYGNQRCA